MNRKAKLLISFLAASAALVGVAIAASSPSVTTGAASSIKNSTAVLNGTVNPNGASTTYFFELGLAKDAYFETGPHPPKSVGSGTAAKAASVRAGGLVPGTTYHYRLTALNRFGQTIGADRTFKTTGHRPPDAATGAAEVLSATSATVTGVVNPHGETTTYYFQYGTTAFYGLQTAPVTVSPGNVAVPVAQTLTGLAPFTTFHYRLVAQHGSVLGTPGTDQTFLTFPLPRAVPRVPVRTTPSRDRKRPYVFTTSGRVTRPRSFPTTACGGNVAMRFFLGRRQVAFSLIALQPNCTFFAQTTFQHLPGRGRHRHSVRLHVRIHFRGNGFLAPVNARTESVILGSG
jgi:phosphodiesterase/alkaline phosphatase D-like protein